MIPLAEALDRVRQQCVPLPPQRRELADCYGGVLAQDITSDIDSPPYDKSLVDGYAVRSHDADTTRKVIETVTAGQVPRHAVTPQMATQIMTGAPIPEGADAVVMREHTTAVDDRTIRVEQSVAEGQNVLPRGSSFQQGEILLPAGKTLHPADVGVLAEAGHGVVEMVPPPVAGILATGDELVYCHHVPGPGQIRNSNGPLLVAAARSAGAIPQDLGIARDHAPSLRDAICQGLERSVLLLSGGVSAGDLDLVPQVLSELEVEQVFHKVSLKPGKPMWFGKLDDTLGRHLVFGLPGNPVSNFICFELFVRPSLAALAGRGFAQRPQCARRMAVAWQHRSDRPTYYPAVFDRDGQTVHPLAWQGSADLATVARATALLVLPPGDTDLAAGDEVAVMDLRDEASAAAG